MIVARPAGKIITFYSYKGGTGRSMALANIAWILASQGKRVLMLDWDLEAPGLHRFLYPFLLDKDLTASDGVIDFVIKFADAAATPDPTGVERSPGVHEPVYDDTQATKPQPLPRDWYKPYANILRYAASLDWKFENGGTLDFIPAGRQGPSYSTRVNSFNWQIFYDRLGGGLLLELAKERMRAEYDYILVDSRTGVSDTAGICTVQMPDLLVVCFTLNNQSIEGARAVAGSVDAQRHNGAGGSRLKVFPIPCRVEKFEKQKLELARDVAAVKFDHFLWHIDPGQRRHYWGQVEIFYEPFYAYEEILATFGDRPYQTNSLLASLEKITSYLTDQSVTQIAPVPETDRQRVLSEYSRQQKTAEQVSTGPDLLRKQKHSPKPGPSTTSTADIIRKKRDGFSLDREEIFRFVEGLTSGQVPDYQASALLMAIYTTGLEFRETADLTEAVMHSGQILDLSEFRVPKINKVSTGGIGDKTSLVIAPVAAAGGLMVPIIAGRSLGYTGGTLDKLESIPGFNTQLAFDEFRRVLRSCGMGFVGATLELAPADRHLYALRDVTSTADSIPLICASILSKQLASGTDGLIVDVKVGSGAFMKSFERASELAKSLVQVGASLTKRIRAIVTDMSQPLGRAVGNALEVIESFETLKGHGPADLVEICREITARMFLLGGLETSLESARRKFDSLLTSGRPLENLAKVIRQQGGDWRVVEDYSYLPSAEHEDSLVVNESGYLAELEAEMIGQAVMLLGASRQTTGARIDPAVGLVFEKKIGDPVKAGDRICTIHANDSQRLTEVRRKLLEAISISPEPPTPNSLIVVEYSDR